MDAMATFTFPLPLADRLEQLVNNEYLSDVVFAVGTDGERMYAHKNILTMASEVFYAQFNGQFEEARQKTEPIAVTDIDPSTFRDILRYAYCEKIDLTRDNVTDVYYASQKYMLTELNEMCEQFFAHKIDIQDVLRVFGDNRKHEFPFVNEKCLAIIRDNPLVCFKHEDFFTLDKKSLEMIVSSTRINCLTSHILEAIQDWAKINDLQFDDARQLAQIVEDMKHRELDCRKLYNFGQFLYVPNVQTELTISSKEPIALYGLGIFVKAMTEPVTEATVTLNVVVKNFNGPGETNFYSVKNIALTTDLHTEELLFEKIIISAKSGCKISASFEKSPALPDLFCLPSFTSIDSAIADLRVDAGNNCVSYLLYRKKSDAKPASLKMTPVLKEWFKTMEATRKNNPLSLG
ncbi:kelch-like protein 40b [Sabethes cyaneus]|uniref:kelch-like protein 40b n=1 Tax=Sabethes cyaneus TaxID=53552 RepID=UPI00237E8AC4|nr:kelch-like protein 40b [Sabethes cyaneus]